MRVGLNMAATLIQVDFPLQPALQGANKISEHRVLGTQNCYFKQNHVVQSFIFHLRIFIHIHTIHRTTQTWLFCYYFATSLATTNARPPITYDQWPIKLSCASRRLAHDAKPLHANRRYNFGVRFGGLFVLHLLSKLSQLVKHAAISWREWWLQLECFWNI